ncbi:MAG: fibronectin type III domain-containing protein, partial [Elusimicrobiota bacterium]|nr:fibronectin type III domain-containing protein [Elusimicrobiota bacterium]
MNLPSTPTLCNIPGAPNFVAVYITSISVSWSEGGDGNPAGTLYELWSSSSAEVLSTGEVIWSGITTTKIHSGLEPNTTHFYRVRAKNHSGIATEYNPAVISTFTWCAIPSSAPFTNVSALSITANWQSNGNSAGTEYYVECSSVAGFSPTTSASGWISQTAWSATSLQFNTTYYFRVKARNYAYIETIWISLGSTRTICNVPGIPDLINATTVSMKVLINENGNTPQTLYSIKCILPTGATNYVQSNGTLGSVAIYRTKTDWETSGSTVTGLSVNQKYTFSVNAKGTGDVPATDYSLPRSSYTMANIPADTAFVSVTTDTIHITWDRNNNPLSPQTSYYCELSSVSLSGPFTYNSGWIVSTYTFISGLISNTTYYARVKARNEDLNETDYSAPVISTSTLARPPINVAHSTNTVNSITWTFQPAGNEQEFFAEVWTTTTTPYSKLKDSNWIYATYWMSGPPDVSLLPNTSYVFYVKARSYSGIPTSSVSATAFTSIEIPTGISFTSVGTDYISLQVEGPLTNLGVLETKLYVSTMPESGLGAGGVSENFDVWWHKPDFTRIRTDTGLQENTTYSYKVKARNADADETDWSAVFTTYTLLNPPQDAHLWIDVTSSTFITVHSSQPTNSALGLTGCEFRNITTGKTYITTGQYQIIDTGLQENTSYQYQLRWRNASGIWTYNSTPTVAGYTRCNDPSGLITYGVATNEIRVRVNRFVNDGILNSGYKFERIGTVFSSNWLSGPSTGYEWIDYNYSIPNSSGTYRVYYRNAESVVTNFEEKTFYTLANKPNPPSVSGPTSTSLIVAISTDSNSSNTEYAIYCSTYQ